MNTLCIIKSAHRYADRRQLIRDTWLKGLPWDYQFILGLSVKEGTQIAEDVTSLRDVRLFPVSDAFQNIAPKLRAALEVGLNDYHKRYDYFFISDDDTFIHVPRLIKAAEERELQNRDYIGWYRENGGHLYPLHYIQGNAYWLSRRAAEIVVASKEMVNAVPDDVAVGRALNEKVWFFHDKRYFPGPNCWEQFPQPNNDTISCHKVLSLDMKKLYEMWENWNAITNI